MFTHLISAKRVHAVVISLSWVCASARRGRPTPPFDARTAQAREESKQRERDLRLSLSKSLGEGEGDEPRRKARELWRDAWGRRIRTGQAKMPS